MAVNDKKKTAPTGNSTTILEVPLNDHPIGTGDPNTISLEQVFSEAAKDVRQKVTLRFFNERVGSVKIQIFFGTFVVPFIKIYNPSLNS